MKSTIKVIKLKSSFTAVKIEKVINFWLAKSYELIAVESFGNSIRIYLIKKI